MAFQLGKIRRHSRRREDLHSNLMKKVLPLVKIILTLLPLLQRRVLLNVLSVWERVILPPNVLTKGLWLCWVMGISLVHLLLALLVLLVRVKVNVMYIIHDFDFLGMSGPN